MPPPLMPPPYESSVFSFCCGGDISPCVAVRVAVCAAVCIAVHDAVCLTVFTVVSSLCCDGDASLPALPPIKPSSPSASMLPPPGTQLPLFSTPPSCSVPHLQCVAVCCSVLQCFPLPLSLSTASPAPPSTSSACPPP